DSLALRAHVLRGKKWRDIDAKLLVPGDVVQVKTGHIIPADLELISGEYLYVDESTLSGESSYVDKIVGDTAYSGTLVQEGDMLGIVTKTGKETRFGKTAELLDRTKTRSRFRASLIQIGNILIAFTVSAALLMLLTDLYRIYIEKSSTETLGGLIIFVLVVMIAGIPVALPAVFSVTLSVGAARIGRFKSIVTRLSVIEELAGMDVLCCDKTGVFTKNSPTVHQIKVFDDHTTEQEVLLVAALASHPERRDVLDNAIIVALNQDTLLSQYSQEKIIPFDSARKRVETIVITPEGQHIRCVKGAPQVVLALTRPNEALATSVMAEIDSFAARGFRTLGVARQIDQTWTFLGLIPLFDPLRPETVPFLRHAKELGISVKMLTGDHIAIATQISRGLELGEHVFPMSSITEEPTKTQENQIANADGFAEASPE
ncbi:MAG: HAD family hydrolase, partial [Gammaproteobacteria bacterium]|nr:HAD family hydrolase [Gammaproteobacteria bacterium]